MGEGSSARKLGKCTTDSAFVEGGAIDSWAGTELVGSGSNEVADSSVQTVVGGGG